MSGRSQYCSAAAFHGTNVHLPWFLYGQSVPWSCLSWILPLIPSHFRWSACDFLMRRSLGTVFPIMFSAEFGCFHLFYPTYKLLKIFAWKLHILLKIEYTLTCVIHFKCTLLLEDIISWHVGDGFYGPLCNKPIWIKRNIVIHLTGYVAWIFLCKYCIFSKNTNTVPDI